MTEPHGGWQAPEPEAGPAPGMEFAGPGARLVGYIVDIFIMTIVIIAAVIVFGLLAVIVPVLRRAVDLLADPRLPLVYFPYFWSKSGQTPGRR